MQRKKGAYGYFWGDTWSETEGKNITDEIALNPDSFTARGFEKVLSTLVHEMCHLEQHHYGKPSRSGYHNTEWSRMMFSVGLIPSHTGEEGGKQTGQNMTHYIEQGGVYQKAFEQLMQDGFTIPWQALTRDEVKAAKKRASKTKYTCPCCGLNAWGKADIHLVCGDCEEVLEAEV
jgi:predicted SprT family Zn-dependent metalloprotease